MVVIGDGVRCAHGILETSAVLCEIGMISDFFISHLDASVRIIFDFVNAHDPMLRRVSFFKHVKLEIFVANFGISHTIITCRFAWKEDLMDNIKYHPETFNLNLNYLLLCRLGQTCSSIVCT